MFFICQNAHDLQFHEINKKKQNNDNTITVLVERQKKTFVQFSRENLKLMQKNCIFTLQKSTK